MSEWKGKRKEKRRMDMDTLDYSSALERSMMASYWLMLFLKYNGGELQYESSSCHPSKKTSLQML